MKCPICGSKMKMDACIYCNISANQVVFASNKKAKEKIRQGKKESVYLTDVKPFDVNRYKLLALTILLGWCGASSYYVGRYKRGLFFSLSVFFGSVFSLLRDVSSLNNWNSFVIQLLFEIALVCCVIALVLWLNDVVRVIMGKFRIPVVLDGENEGGEGENLDG